ncbi:hypothetical protein CC53_gp145 [Rhizobium phage vB_RleS_L338C]|nr:hypothetical protein CC53_gp145 [Rhizobium phage vB_RleS_L338C]AHC30562.1 hypothetical protein L338C_145 [Rhizobium phage vB_RleS_L338C]QNH72197.1 hypothetical protein P11VFA_005 [Rhizobium phage P11VFA]
MYGGFIIFLIWMVFIFDPEFIGRRLARMMHEYRKQMQKKGWEYK